MVPLHVRGTALTVWFENAEAMASKVQLAREAGARGRPAGQAKRRDRSSEHDKRAAETSPAPRTEPAPPLARRHPSIDPCFFSTIVAITNPLFHTISKPLLEAARMLPIW